MIGERGRRFEKSTPKPKKSLFFSLLAGNLEAETVSTATASATIFVHFRGVHLRVFAFDSRHSLANRWSGMGVVRAAFRIAAISRAIAPNLTGMAGIFMIHSGQDRDAFNSTVGQRGRMGAASRE
jgi:hypothetical protein